MEFNQMRLGEKKCKKRKRPWRERYSEKVIKKRAMVARQVGLPPHKHAWQEPEHATKVGWLEARMAVHQARWAWNANTAGDGHGKSKLEAAEKTEAEYAVLFNTVSLGVERTREELNLLPIFCRASARQGQTGEEDR